MCVCVFRRRKATIAFVGLYVCLLTHGERMHRRTVSNRLHPHQVAQCIGTVFHIAVSIGCQSMLSTSWVACRGSASGCMKRCFPVMAHVGALLHHACVSQALCWCMSWCCSYQCGAATPACIYCQPVAWLICGWCQFLVENSAIPSKGRSWKRRDMCSGCPQDTGQWGVALTHAFAVLPCLTYGAPGAWWVASPDVVFGVGVDLDVCVHDAVPAFCPQIRQGHHLPLQL